MSEACCQCSCCGVAKSWQGKLELVFRILSLVFSFLVAACAIWGVAYFNWLDTISIQPMDDDGLALFSRSEAALGWMAVVGIVVVIVETVMLGRFCCSSGLCNTTALLIVDSVIGLMAALGLLCGAIALVVYSPTLRETTLQRDSELFNAFEIAGILLATGVLGFLAVVMLFVLGVFVILSLAFKWKNASQDSKSTV